MKKLVTYRTKQGTKWNSINEIEPQIGSMVIINSIHGNNTTNRIGKYHGNKFFVGTNGNLFEAKDCLWVDCEDVIETVQYITRDNITDLEDNEIFVFGSNLQGQHLGGAARIAANKFGAKFGVGQGMTGQCYAIPTMHGCIEEIRPYVNVFVKYATEHTDKMFLVTRIGCGIAGFTDEEMAPLFKGVLHLSNVALPKSFVEVLDK